MTLIPKPGILDIEPYKGGKSKIQGKAQVIKLSSNETPLGPSPKAIEAYKKASAYLHRYPDDSTYDLRHAIGNVHHLDPERIICGAGSDEIISLLCRAYAGYQDEIIYTQHGFLMYPINAKAVGAKPIAVAETHLKTDIETILTAVTPRTKIVFIANPNNPTGSYINKATLHSLRARLRQDILLVLDGAYTEYVNEPDYSAGIELVDSGDNTVMTRTFSKIYGLAALRLGWGYCPASIIDILQRIRDPFNTSFPANAAGVAAAEDQAFIKHAQDFNREWRQWLHEAIVALGLHVHPSATNFLLVQFPGGAAQAEAANQHLLNEGIIVRLVRSYGLPECLRITVGLEKENKAVVKALGQFMKLK